MTENYSSVSLIFVLKSLDWESAALKKRKKSLKRIKKMSSAQ